MKKNNVCICGTVYSLLVYLLYASDEDLKSTTFFTANTIPQSVLKRIPNNNVFSIDPGRFERIKYLLKYRVFSAFSTLNIGKATIYAQDHLLMSPILISQNNYILIEDAPNIFSLVKDFEYIKDANSHISNRGKIREFIDNRISKSSFRYIGNNSLCIGALVTTKDSAEYMNGKNLIIVNFYKQWQEASEFKKNYILSIFSLNNNDTGILKKKKIIIFTQPFYNDNLISLEEHLNIYKSIISKYNIEEVVLKTHPRDKVDYKRVFKDLYVFDLPVPFQLLNAMGLRFTEAVTISSSSVFSFDYQIKINWIGTEIHPAIRSFYGDIKPDNFIKQK